MLRSGQESGEWRNARHKHVSDKDFDFTAILTLLEAVGRPAADSFAGDGAQSRQQKKLPSSAALFLMRCSDHELKPARGAALSIVRPQARQSVLQP